MHWTLAQITSACKKWLLLELLSLTHSIRERGWERQLRRDIPITSFGKNKMKRLLQGNSKPALTFFAVAVLAVFASANATAQELSVTVPETLIPFSDSSLSLGVGFGDGEMQFGMSFSTAVPEKMTLPTKPADLDEDWVDQNAKGPNRTTFKHKTSGLVIHFDKAVAGSGGWGEKDHWHIENPNWKKADKKKGFYVDVDGIPVDKGKEKSHILPGTEVTLPVKSEKKEMSTEDSAMKLEIE